MNFSRRPAQNSTPHIERLPRGWFNGIRDQMLRIGCLTMLDTIQQAPAPCTITRSFLDTPLGLGIRTMLDIEFEIRRDVKSKSNKIVQTAATLTEFEPYNPDESFDLCSWRRLKLNLVRPSKAYETGAYITNNSDTSITLDLNEPFEENGASRRSAAWSEIESRLRPRFGRPELNYFMAHLAFFAHEFTPPETL